MSQLIPSPVIFSQERPARVQRLFKAMLTILVMVGMVIYGLLWLMQALPSQAQSLPQLSTIYYVTTEGTGANACTQLDPCALQHAVNLATDGDAVHVAGGTYLSESVTPTLRINKSIMVLGGFSSSDWDAGADPVLRPTILDAGGSGRVVRIDSGSSVIAGFTIQNGSLSDRGAGVFINGGSVALRHNIIAHNTSSGNLGAAVYVSFEGQAEIISSTIRHNNGNSAIAVEGTADIHYSLIHNNQSTAGTIRNFSESSVSVIGNLLYANQATLGGGVYAQHEALIVNNTIVANSASTNGGGIYIGPGTSTITITNNIVANNTGGGTTGIFNSSASATILGGYNNVYINTSNVSLPETITDNPEFINPANNNYRLREGSPNIDSGDPNTDPAINIDLDGNARPNGAAIDRGAYEFYPGLANFTLEPAFLAEQFEERGTMAVYNHLIENIGTTVTDTYTFTCTNDQGWSFICPVPVTDLETGGQEVITTSLDIPANADPFQTGYTIITATSVISPALQRVAVIETIVRPNISLTFTPNYTATLLPGDAITFTHQLVNTGDYTETFRLTLGSDPLGWGQLLPANNFVRQVAPNQEIDVRVRVEVPPFAAAGLANQIEVVATSTFDPTISEVVVNTVTASGTTGPRYVRTNGNNTNNNCTQITMPCRTVPHAIGQAAAGDTIFIAQGTYQVAETQINDTLHLSGGWNNSFQSQSENPAQTVLQGTGTGRLFTIAPGSSLLPTFTRLTLTGGNATTGGAVSVGALAQPRFTGVHFRQNQAGQGGAIFAGTSSLVRLEQTRFITNSATTRGGAIYNVAGTIILDRAVFSGNSTSSSGTADGGGAIYSNNGLLDVINSLFTQNSSARHGGAVRANAGLVQMLNNTVVHNNANNGGGFYNAGANATLTNVLLSDNTAVSGGAVFHDGGTTQLRYSLLWNNDVVGPVSSSNIVNGDPLFSDDQFRLSPGSAAVDTGDPDTPLDIDFEGDFRPSDQGFDIGYDELAGCIARRDGINYGSIQEALDAPGAVSNLIRVSGICRGVNSREDGGQTVNQTVFVNQSVHIQGGWDDRFQSRTFAETIIDPEGNGRGIYITGSGITPTLESLTIINGDAGGLGGGPTDIDAGGGIYNRNGSVTLYAVSVYSSTAQYGSAYYNHQGNTSYYNLFPDVANPAISDGSPRLSLLQHNHGGANSRAGAIYHNGGNMLLDGLIIRHNSANEGGAIYNQTGTLRTENLILAENSAVTGGAIFDSAIGSQYWHSTIYGNQATNSAGIHNQNGSITIQSNLFQENSSNNNGGAIHVVVGVPTINYNYYYESGTTPVTGAGQGANDIDSDVPPGLINPVAGNYQLGDDTPAVDQANPDSTITRDFLGNPRPANQAPDMGAHEVVGCLARIVRGTGQNQTVLLFGSIQVAIDTAFVGETIDVAGRCTGVHPYESGSQGTIYQTVHLVKNVNLLGGWRTNFSQRDAVTLLDAQEQGRVLYIGSAISATVRGFHIAQGNASANGMNGLGGGIFVAANSSPQLLENQVYSNTAVSGAGFYAANSAPVVDRGNRFFANEASDSGGALYVNNASAQEAIIQNNFIYSNTAGSGAGFYNAAGENRFWHNTLLGNAAAQGGGIYIAAGGPSIRNNIVMNSSGNGAFGAASAMPSFGYNNFFGNTPNHYAGTADPGPGALSVDPQFTDLENLDLTLTPTSPVANMGDPSLTGIARDFENDIRPSNQGFDIGADEIGGCFARVLAQPGIVYGSAQLAVQQANSGDTVQVSGICQNVNQRQLGDTTIYQNLFLNDIDLTIDGDWNYQGNGPGVLDALGLGRVVYIGSSAAITMTGITLQGGNAALAGNENWGGGVYVEGQATLLGVPVRDNLAERGGAIYNDGTLILGGNSLIANNQASLGAGLYNGVQGMGGATINQTRFTGNAASDDGGAVYQGNGLLHLDGNRLYQNSAVRGAAVFLSSGNEDTVHVFNNFIYRNTAFNRGGAIYNLAGSSLILHNTMFANTAVSTEGGAIFSNSGTPDIRNNIIDRNNGSGLHVLSGAPIVSHNNAYENDPFNYVGVAAGPGAINQLPFYYNEAQDDFHLNTGSPGIDAGIDLGVPTDIDGELRPTNLAPDMGADEYSSCLIRVGGTGGELFGVLQDAIDHAVSNNLTLLEVARGECSGVKTVNGSQQVGYITTDLEIHGSLRRGSFTNPNDFGNPEIEAVSTVFNALGQGRVIVVAEGANPSFHNIALVGGNAFSSGGGNNGGAILNQSADLSMSQSPICASTAEFGGGYYGGSGSTADLSGTGAGRCQVARFDVRTNEYLGNDLFSGNTATQQGGGLYLAGGGTLEVRNYVLRANEASDSGGGFYNAGNADLINAIFYQNLANNGGAIYNSATLRLFHNTIRTNAATTDGGGIYNDNGSLVVNSTIVFENVAGNDDGSGLYNSSGSTELSHNNFFANESNVGFGSSPVIADPGLTNIWYLRIDSPNIDKADPDLLDPDNVDLPTITYDANDRIRPDGHTIPNYTGLYGYESDIGAYEYRKDFGCAVRPINPTATILPGQTITYSMHIFNTGNPSFLNPNTVVSYGYTDTLTVTLTSSQAAWTALQGGDAQAIELGHRQFATRILTVTVPITAQLGLQDVSNVRCTSQSVPTRSNVSNVTTNVGQVSALLVTPSYQAAGVPGEVFTFEHTVTNNGNDVELVTITPSAGPRHATAELVDEEGLPLGNQIVSLAPTESVIVWLRVQLLDTATAGDTATPGLIATPSSDPTRFASVLNEIEIGHTAGTRYVAAEGTLDNTNCTDLNNPCATIQHAHDQATAGDTVLVAGGTYNDVVTRTVGLEPVLQTLVLSKDITILGGYDENNDYEVRQPLTRTTILTGEENRRVIYVSEGITVNLQSLYITGGDAGDQLLGGGLYNAGATLHISGTWLLNNAAETGGGLYHAAGQLTINSSVLANNEAEDGAGLYVAEGTVWLENNTFADNTAVATGGGLYQAAGSLHLVNTIFADNSAATNGAAFVDDAVTLTDSHNLYHQNGPDDTSFTPTDSIGGDPMFIDDFYRIGPDSAAKDTGTSDETLVNFVAGGLDFELEPRLQGIEVDIGADELLQIPNFTFEPAFDSAMIDPGGSHVYSHTLRNTGDFVDTYSLSLSTASTPPDGTWTHVLSPPEGTPITLEEGEAISVTLTVSGLEPGYMDEATITAVSNTGLERSVVDTTRVSQEAGVAIGNSESGDGRPGETVVYSHVLTNTGDGPDSYSLTYLNDDPAGWTITIDPAQTAQLMPGATTPFTVSVTIPQGVISGTIHQVMIQAASMADPDVTDTLTNTTAVGVEPGLSLTPGESRIISSSGVTEVYTHTLSNLGNGTELVTFSASSSLPDWNVTVEPPSMSLPPFASDTVTVSVSVPTAAGGLSHTAVITAAGASGVTATAVNTTTVQAVYTVLIGPDRTAAAEPGEMVFFSHTVTNTGTIVDSYELTVDAPWDNDVTPNTLTLAAGESETVTVSVEVSDTAAPDTYPVIVTVTSTTDPGVTDSANNSIVVGPVGERRLLLTPQAAAATGTPGMTVIYNHTLHNTGTQAENVNLSALSSNGWTVTVTPPDVMLPAGGQTAVTVAVQIPADAAMDTVDVTTVRAISDDEMVTATAVDTTTVGLLKLYLPIIAKPDTGVPPEPPPDPTPSPTPTLTPTPTATPIGCPTNVDLIVYNLTVEPASPVAGVPALVSVAIQNQGTADVTPGNNFYLDFYVNQDPQPYLVGDHYWGVQGSLMTAGAIVTFTTHFTFTTTGTQTLYAQVDTDNSVQECGDEDNNISDPVEIEVTGEGQEAVTPPVRERPGVRGTPTPVGPGNTILPGEQGTPRPGASPTPIRP
jgi:uncharacterized membrane protein